MTTAAAVATVSVTGFPLAGKAAAQSPSLSLSQSVSPTTVNTVGENATFSFVVTNNGDEPLTGVTVTTTSFSGTAGPLVVSCQGTDLAPGSATTCTAPYTVTQADIDAGGVTSIGTATGRTSTGSTVTAPGATATLAAIQSAAISLQKAGAPSGGNGGGGNDGGGGGNNGGGNNGGGTNSRRSTSVTTLTVGQTISYTYDVMNTGNVTLTGVSVTDTSFSGTGTPPAISCPATTLPPGESMTCTGSYTVTQADVAAGSITNTATATGTPPSGPPVTSGPATATVTSPQNQAGLALDKIAITSGGGGSGGNSRRNTLMTTIAVGEPLIYYFTVTNTGNVDLTDINVTDTSFSGTGTPPAISCPSAILPVGTSFTCSATYTVTQADVTAGTITNTATATGTPPYGPPVTSPPATATVTGPPAALTLDKIVSVAGGGGGGGHNGGGNNGGGNNRRNTVVATLTPGQVLDYSYVVTNTGNVTLTGLSVTDTSFSGKGTPPVITCPSTPLEPGASITCTATYTVTQADIDAGTITNTATATGTPPSGPPVTSPPATATVTLTRSPALTLAKSASPATVTAAGQTVTYTLVATNSGNVTLTGITVADTAFSGSGTAPTISCPTGPLAPGGSTTCTGTYTVTAADLRQGHIDNTAVATATGPGSTTVTSGPATARVAATPPQSAPSPSPSPSPSHIPSPSPSHHPSGQPHPPHGQLPETGAGNLTLIGAAGALLLAAGVPVLLTANRRRRPQAGSADQGTRPME
ncbi:hypothetical protein [Kitasatospora sp. NPDC127116]|uniref:DUF7507 domain-containing protein n=1 Tax=Kitasatospora sp. NPDC127116 TaxID=3345367 RepID=UPI00363B0518